MIHLYAAPGDFPETLCGRNKAWAQPGSAVYPKDLALVDCPDCIARCKPEHVKASPRRAREPDPVYVMCWIAVLVGVILTVLWRWLP